MESRQCNQCKWYFGGLSCAAYPGGIPAKILLGEPHDKVRKGQTLDFVYTREDE